MISALYGLNPFCLFAQQSENPDRKTMEQLAKFRSEYTDSWLQQKPEMLMNYYSDHVTLMTEFQKTILGKRDVLAYYKAFFRHHVIKSYTREAFEWLDLGSMVVENGQFKLTGNAKSTQLEFQLNGKYMNIWKRENEKLELIMEGWNYNHPLRSDEQLRFSEVPVYDVALQAHLPVNSAIRFELAALNKLQESTITEHDDKIWAQFYTDDAIIFSQFNDLQQGKKEIAEYLSKHASDRPIFEKLDIRNNRIDDLGMYVIEYASHVAFWRRAERSGVNMGKDIRIWRREANGSLKIFRHMGMYD
jgi:ketosteroid isomerase-like protein